MNQLTMNVKISDYLFMQFRCLTPTLEQVCKIYYPHLSKAKILEKARNMEFPFVCFKMDDSQKSPYFVDIIELSFIIEEKYSVCLTDFNSFMQSVLKHNSGS